VTEEVRLHLDRANGCIAEAELLLDGGRFGGAVARAYYAMFHAATAALLKRDIKRRSHQGLISTFGQFLVKPGYVESRFHKFFAEVFDLRQESDYQPIVQVTDQQADEIIKRAKEFVEVCRSLCQ